MQDKILVIGACGQLGLELTAALREIYGDYQVVASDIHNPTPGLAGLPFERLDATDGKRMAEIVAGQGITQIYHLAAILSARGEQNPLWAWDINMKGLINVLEIAREHKLRKVYWPSSIACFGPSTPSSNTPQHTVMEPTTVYGISKLAGELWCQYYFDKYGVDARSLRYPGLIGYKTLPGGGTTDYAVDIYHKAVDGQAFECFLSESTYLPMMYMPDAIRATVGIMEAPAEQVRLHTSYNVAGMSFSPAEVAEAIRQEIPGFSISYKPDFRQQIADSWPDSIDDSAARADWGWAPAYDLAGMTRDMIAQLREQRLVKA
jgi:nucleoside-diphosphate-sugar epimerase